MARLRGVYKNELALKLKEELGLENVMQVPRITKITLNMGVGGAAQDKTLADRKTQSRASANPAACSDRPPRPHVTRGLTMRRAASRRPSHL